MRGLLDELASPHSLLGMLPGIYAEDELARRLVEAFDDSLAPVFATLDNLPAYLDPALAPDDFLRWLGRWVAAVDDPDLSQQRRRALVARALGLHARRGTAAGLAELIELVTGRTPQIDESGAVTWSTTPGAQPPGKAIPQLVVWVETSHVDDARLLEAVVDTSRPAHLPYRIEVPT